MDGIFKKIYEIHWEGILKLLVPLASLAISIIVGIRNKRDAQIKILIETHRRETKEDEERRGREQKEHEERVKSTIKEHQEKIEQHYREMGSHSVQLAQWWAQALEMQDELRSIEIMLRDLGLQNKKNEISKPKSKKVKR